MRLTFDCGPTISESPRGGWGAPVADISLLVKTLQRVDSIVLSNIRISSAKNQVKERAHQHHLPYCVKNLFNLVT